MYYQTGHRCSSMLHPRGKYQDAESDTLTSKGGASTHWCKSWTKNWWAQNLQTWFCLPRVLTAPNGYHGQNVLFRKLNTQKELIWVRWLKQGSIFRSIRYPSSLRIQILFESSAKGIHLWDDSNSIKTSQRFITNCWYLPCCFWENTFVKFWYIHQMRKS